MLCFQNDPFWTAGSLSRADYLEAANQSVCKLEDMLEVIKDNTSLILNFQDLPAAHPYYSTYINITLETILASGIRQQAVSSVGLGIFPKSTSSWFPLIFVCLQWGITGSCTRGWSQRLEWSPWYSSGEVLSGYKETGSPSFFLSPH